MTQSISISEVRQNLSGLLKKLRKNPELSICITLNGIPVGELRPFKAKGPRFNAGAALLGVAGRIGRPQVELSDSGSVAEDHDFYLY